jgi:hypothetical protein
MRVSVSGKANAVQPPKLWPTMAMRLGSGRAVHGIASASM